ncbi:MAG TPA: hypothetical protein VGX68_27000 [Thermoanaerobaculia bacterium]|jgi:hypothetical protein|nr:hypothetical protein [Thermoanaerobaculia bacterium]
MFRKTANSLAALILAAAWIVAGRAEAQLYPSSAVLLPYFEVDLGGTGKTTMFAVGNVLGQPVDIAIEVRTNWGIVVATIPLKLEAHEVRSFNLRDWLVQGKLPNKTLKLFEKNHLKATLSGQASPQDKLYYSTVAASNLAVGSVVIKVQGVQPAGALWGDFLLIDPANDISKGDDLVNLDKATTCPGAWLCLRHALRYLSSADLDADTQVIFWTDRAVQPSKNPYPESRKVAIDGTAYNEEGKQIGGVHLRLLPLQIVAVESLKLLEPFGWLDLESEEPTFIGLHFDSIRRDGAALQAYCLKDTPKPPHKGPKIEIEKRTNDQDADSAPGPTLAVGSPVRWDYIVTNSGDVRLTDITVSDDQGVQVNCPKTALDPGESMTCYGTGTAVACQYVNVGTATGKPPSGSDVTAEDASHYYGGQNPKIDIETATNGQDADTPPGPTVQEGSTVSWTYGVTNTGEVNLTDVKVTDSKGVAVSCPKTSLRPGESMTCTASGTAGNVDYENIGSVTAKSPCDDTVKDSDPSHYHPTGTPPEPKLSEITIKKYTNGQDADVAPGPTIEVGDPVKWTYVVTNTGDTVLNNVKVTDNRGVAVSCPKTTLQPNEAMTCTGNGTAVAGQYKNIGTAVGTPPSGPNVTATDPSHYFGCVPPPPTCGIKIKKYTNGHDADTAPGPEIPVGDPVHWTYVVTNMGEVALSNVMVTDNRGVAVSCPKTALQPGEAMTCTGNGTATAGQYENIGTVVGTAPGGSGLRDSDPSHYYGKLPPPPPQGQGCTPGYWKNHTDSWPPTGYSPSQKVQSVFNQAANYPTLGNASLLDALSFQGGSTIEGAAGNLLRAGVAALLDASHPNVNYPRTPASVISDVSSALASGNRDTMLGLASRLDADNNLGCPLN